MSKGGEGISGVEKKKQEEIEDVLDEEVEDLGEKKDEVPKRETARETVERLLKESKKEAVREDEDGETEEEDAVQSEAPVKRKRGRPRKDEAASDAVITPPSRLTAEEKAAFSSYPREMQAAIVEQIKGHETAFSKAMAKANAEAKESANLRESVRPYLMSRPHLMSKYSEGEFVRTLIAAHEQLTNPKTSDSALLQMGRDLGYDLSSVVGRRDAGTGGEQSSSIEFQTLQKEIAALKSQVAQPAISNAVSEMESVRNEKDAGGNLLYPELYDSDFLNKAKPLVSALVGASPGLGYGDALRRAYFALKGQAGVPEQVTQAKLPATENHNRDRATAAAVSVRGRVGAPAASNNLQEFPSEALKSPRDSVQWALQQLRGR